MNAIQENKVSMMFKLRTYFNNHLATLSPFVSQLPLFVDNLNTKLDEIQTYDTEATDNNTGNAIQKSQYKEAMRDLALIVSGGIKAFGLANSDILLVKKYSITKSDITLARDTDALYACERIATYANGNSSALEAFGVAASTLTDFDTAISNYKAVIQNPKDQITESETAGNFVDRAIAEADGIIEIIDALMLTQSLTEPFLYMQYTLTRKIDDNTGGDSPQPPDFTVALNPMVFTVGFDLPYVGSQKIRVKNLSTETIEWGLSTSNISFTNPIQVLGANQTSNYFSSTLGPNGNFLLLQNKGTAPASVEITLVDE